MNKKLVNEFSHKLETLDSGLEFEVLEDDEIILNKDYITSVEKGTVLISYNGATVFALTIVSGEPAIVIDKPIMIDKDNSVLFGDLTKLCGQYLDAFFGGDKDD